MDQPPKDFQRKDSAEDTVPELPPLCFYDYQWIGGIEFWFGCSLQIHLHSGLFCFLLLSPKV